MSEALFSGPEHQQFLRAAMWGVREDLTVPSDATKEQQLARQELFGELFAKLLAGLNLHIHPEGGIRVVLFYNPFGMTADVVLMESSANMHTYFQYDRRVDLAIDSCSATASLCRTPEVLKALYRPDRLRCELLPPLNTTTIMGVIGKPQPTRLYQLSDVWVENGISTHQK